MSEQVVSKSKLKTKDLTIIALFSALIAICAWITIPIPDVPFTLQVFAVFTALCTLGGRRGTIAIALYILLGMVGLPVFSGFRGGIGVLLGTTGGYIAGFLVSGLVYWLIMSLVKKENIFTMTIALLFSLCACYAFGTVWYMMIYLRQSGTIGFGAVLMKCVVPYLIPDLVKMALAITVSSAIKKSVRF